MLKSGMRNEILDQIAREVLSEVQGKSHLVQDGHVTLVQVLVHFEMEKGKNAYHWSLGTRMEYYVEGSGKFCMLTYCNLV